VVLRPPFLGIKNKPLDGVPRGGGGGEEISLKQRTNFQK
jgi:hypothetical protein